MVAPAQPRPRVLILVTLAEHGGVGSYTAALLPGLVARFDVTVAAHGPGPLGEVARAAGASYVDLRHVRRAIHPLRDAIGLIELVRLCRRIRPHVLHANSAKAGVLGRLAAWLCRVPVRIYTAHGWAFATHPGRTSFLYVWGEKLVRPITSATVCVSRSEFERGLRGAVADPSRMVVIPNAIDLDRPRRVTRPPGSRMRIVSVGRFAAPKDFVTLVRAVAELPPEAIEVVLLGDGPDRPAIEAEVERLGLAGVVALAGKVGDVADRLARADVLVLSTRSEAMPMTVLEAMAAGLPVVASAVGGVPELVTDGETGFLVPPDDAPALAAALGRLLADPLLRERLGATARERAQRHHDVAPFQQAYVELYLRELSARTSTGSDR